MITMTMHDNVIICHNLFCNQPVSKDIEGKVVAAPQEHAGRE